MKEEKKHIQTNGTVIAVLGNSTFRVKCENGKIIIANIAAEFRNKRGKKTFNKTRITEGNMVIIRLPLNDLSLGSIISFA